jgi:hypothetical protein
MGGGAFGGKIIWRQTMGRKCTEKVIDVKVIKCKMCYFKFFKFGADKLLLSRFNLMKGIQE